MTRTRRRWRLAVSIGALVLVVGACGDGGGDASTPPETSAPGATEAEPTETTASSETTATAGTGDTTAESGEPIKIGMLTDMSVTFTQWGVNVRDGMLLAAEEINAAGGVNGRMIEIVQADTENDAEVGVQALERLAEEGVVAVGGIVSSGVAAPVAPVAEELQIPTFLVKAGTEAALTRDSRFVFRTCLPAAPMTAPPLLQYAQEQGLTNVGVIIADYPWGQSFRAAVEQTFEGSGVDYGEIQVAPVPPDTDFTPYVRAVADAGAELLIATGHPPGNAPIVALAADLIPDVIVTGAWIPPDLAVGSLAETAIGRYADFSCVDYTSDEYAGLARRYLEFSDNAFMSDDAVAAYGIVQMVADAVANVGDDPVAIAEYLHGQTYDLEGYAHPMSWTEWGELAESQPVFTVISEGPAPEGLNEAGDWWFEKLSQSEPLEPYEP